jgi:serine/threonine protein kinase
LHQDLKPNNIFIKDGKFKIADFDLSILMNESSNKVSTAVQGTFTYMSL